MLLAIIFVLCMVMAIINKIVKGGSTFQSILTGIIGTALVWIARMVGFFKKPEEAQNSMLEDHENRIKELERKANRDFEQISSVQEEMKVLLMGTHALLRHAIDGNDTDSLKQAENDISF